MNSISTHVLDTSRGEPATGVRVTLEVQAGLDWTLAGEAVTNAEGRVASFSTVPLESGIYRLKFDTGAYQAGFYPEVTVTFRVESPPQHYHVPLLLSPFGYSTYRGS